MLGGTTPQSRGVVNYLALDLAPGEYGFVCFLPDVKDGKMHVEHGMIHQFKIG
jgi:hypothetical protein